MFDIAKNFGFDAEMADGGVKYELDATGKQFLIVKKIPNDDYSRELAKEYRRHENVLKLKGEKVEELAEEIMGKVLAKTVLIGWEGISMKGKKLPYSVDNAAKVLLEFPLLRAAVVEFAQEVTHFRVEEDVEAVKKP